jgi:hypothetical protein
MLKKIVMAAFTAALTVLVVPAAVSAYGACHVSSSHYGSYGGYHSSATVARGPEGNVYAAGHTTAYGTGGSAYHSGGYTYGDAQRNPGYSSGSSGYHYAPSYSGAAYGHTASYSYVR